MLSTLLLNFALLITLTYLFSLSLRSWPLPEHASYRVQTALSAALISLVLLLHPAEVTSGVIIDMRSVPLVYLSLVYGSPAALMASLPMLAYRYTLGGPGMWPAFGSLALVLLTAAVIQRFFPFGKASWQQRALLSLLMFAPNGLPLLLLPAGPELLRESYLPLLTLNAGGFLIATLILNDRVKLLQLNALFQRQARQDDLSGLLNRRQFDLDLLGMQRGDLLLMVDIDHFKRVNDTYGHAAGDQVIAAIGQVLRDRLRVTDQAYRYGGEEFAVLIRSPQPYISATVAERICTHIAQTPLVLPQQGRPPITLHLTVSLGGAHHTAGTTPAHTLALADQALYQAKQQGRNRWVIHPGPQSDAH